MKIDMRGIIVTLQSKDLPTCHIKLLLSLTSCNIVAEHRHSDTNVFSHLSDCSKVVGKLCMESWEAETSVENRDAVDCLVIGLEETSEGGNDSKESQMTPGCRLRVLMVERFGLIHVSVHCSYR